MTREIINTGTSANDGTGDSLRSGANKINANFQEIYEKFGTADVLSSRIEFDSDEILIQGVSGFKTSIGVVNPTYTKLRCRRFTFFLCSRSCNTNVKKQDFRFLFSRDSFYKRPFRDT